MSDYERRQKLTYAFGHFVAAFGTDAHAGDSGDLARDVLRELGLDERAIDDIAVLAEEVAGNYEYTGKADDVFQRIEAGEL